MHWIKKRSQKGIFLILFFIRKVLFLISNELMNLATRLIIVPSYLRRATAVALAKNPES